jgi:hypothetical protein
MVIEGGKSTAAVAKKGNSTANVPTKLINVCFNIFFSMKI